MSVQCNQYFCYGYMLDYTAARDKLIESLGEEGYEELSDDYYDGAFKKKVEIRRSKRIDWSKVKTVEQMVNILSGMAMFANASADEALWDNPNIKDVLSTTIIEKTYVNGLWDSEKEYDERTP